MQAYRVHARSSKGTLVTSALPTYEAAQAAVVDLLARTTTLRKIEVAVEKYGETSFHKVTFVRRSKAQGWTVLVDDTDTRTDSTPDDAIGDAI